jgi:glutathione S-transferase
MLYITRDIGLHDPAGADRDLARLEKLVEDLRAIRAGAAPGVADLAAAPILDPYLLTAGVVPVLGGAVTGHPELPGHGRMIRTTGLWAIAPDHGWARTLTRWYRLGRHHDQTDLSS